MRSVFLLALLLPSCSTTPQSTIQVLDSSCQHDETTIRCVKVNRVYDGDTLFVDLNGTDLPPVLTRELGVRVARVDAPEMRSKSCEKKKALIAETAFKNGITLVTADKNLIDFFKVLGGSVYEVEI